MNKPIKTYEDFLEEKERLTHLLAIHKQKLTDDWTGVKQELLPVGEVVGVIGKMTKGDKSNPLVNIGLRLASDVLLKSFVFAKAGWVTKLAVPFIVKNYSSHLLADQTKSFFEKIGRIVKKVGKKRSSAAASNGFGHPNDNDEPPADNTPPFNSSTRTMG